MSASERAGILAVVAASLLSKRQALAEMGERTITGSGERKRVNRKMLRVEAGDRGTG